MSDTVIDFDAAKDRRTEREIDADQARWDELQRGLVELMTASHCSDIAITSAGLSALLDVLEAGGASRPDAKHRIVQALAAFLDEAEEQTRIEGPRPK